MHIPAEILLITMRNAGIPIRHSRKGFSRLQVHSCPGCGVCIDACPLSAVPANVKDTTVYLNRQLKRNNRRRIEEISDKCLLCGKCSAVCPVGVEGDRLRIAQRGTRKYKISADYSMIDENSFVKDKGRRVLYFAGCMTHLTPGIKNALISILETVGEDYSLMDEDGGICCGRPMLTAGRKDAARLMMEKNTEIIRSSGASVLLLSCPICYKIFMQDYKLEGIEVIHHSEYIDRLISEKRLDISRTDLKYAYHDPCELGRGCGIYENPRNVVSAAGILVEGTKNRKESICCGGSLGSLTLSEENRRRLAENALDNLMATSPDAVVTACPLCKNTFNRHASVPVVDIAEIVAHSYVKTT
jgi:Fe-S oxidoreductase